MTQRLVICARCERERPVHSRNLCKSCNNWAARHGKLDDYELAHLPGEQWISEIDQSDPVTCWQWPGPLDTHGYGQLFSRGAHRVLYERWVGPIPVGLEVDHICHNLDRACKGGSTCKHRSCVNPAHMEACTPYENQIRSQNTWAGARFRPSPDIR